MEPNLNQVKRRKSAIKASLADKLDAGSDALRSRTESLRVSTGEAAIAADGKLTAVTGTVASGMSSTAQFLRDTDIDRIKETVEVQVREHPVRTLLVALGAGYLLGKALRR
jgi:ElaB/YqjD/DUF883 family membrane-anchored ribosome-binding protein